MTRLRSGWDKDNTRRWSGPDSTRTEEDGRGGIREGGVKGGKRRTGRKRGRTIVLELEEN